jgi:hypothetical protein
LKKITLPFIFLIALQVNAVTRYVVPSPTGAGLANGTSWANALPGTSLQAAITASATGDEVWVMTGTYLTTTSTNRNIYFSMVNGVGIYGSFAGTETSISQRNFSCGYGSVLSAEIGVAGNADNSYHVINNSSLNNTAILDGFTITGGHANFDLLGNDPRSLGGGILNTGSGGGLCSPVIRNCLFTDNTALFGGGIFNHGQNGGNANPVITNCIFTQNTATGGGGAIDNFGYNGNASPTITNSIFYNNTATDRAGAMYCWGGGNGNASPAILNCLFINNSSVDGGAIVSDRTNFVSGNSGTANPTVRNCVFWGNTASGTGPQFYILGGANFTATYSVVDISNQNTPHTITGPGTGNISTAPAFLDIANAIGPDNCWFTNDDGLQFQTGSVGINTGDNTGVPSFDIRNFSRIAGSVVDMNAYEFNSSILPVRLLNFFGRAGNDANFIFWSTASEQQHHHFEILRSHDGQNFETIGSINATGNSNTTKQYGFTDDQPRQQKQYYRLKQLDTDGAITLSNIIVLTSKTDKQHILAFPNPVKNIATIIFDEPIKGNESFLLLNNNGQLIDRITISGRTGKVDLGGNATGLYLLVNHKLGLTVKLHKIAE